MLTPDSPWEKMGWQVVRKAGIQHHVYQTPNLWSTKEIEDAAPDITELTIQ